MGIAGTFHTLGSASSGGGGADSVAQAGVASNRADITTIQSTIAGKADQAALDAVVATNATDTELAALAAQVGDDEALVTAARQPDMSILVTVRNIITNASRDYSIAAPTAAAGPARIGVGSATANPSATIYLEGDNGALKVVHDNPALNDDPSGDYV